MKIFLIPIFSAIMILYPITSMSQISHNLLSQKASPERTIIYTAYDPVNQLTSLYTSNSDGSRQFKLYDSVCITGRALFSSDGKYITFQNANEQQLIIDTAGNELFRFPGGGRSDQDFIWGVDLSIYYGKYVDGIYRFSIANSKLIKIMSTSGYTYDHNPAISPSNGKIAFVKHKWGSSITIYTMTNVGQDIWSIPNSTKDTWTDFDEQLNLNWVDENHLIFHSHCNYTRSINGKVYNYSCPTLFYTWTQDPGTKITTYIPPRAMYHEADGFHYLALSPDKKYLALYGAQNLYDALSFIETSQLGTDKLTFRTTNLAVSAFAWSKNAKYFIASVDNKLKIFDTNLNEYKFINLPNIGTIKFVNWSTTDPGNLVSVTDEYKVKEKQHFYNLTQNYPNPFNSSTKIQFSLQKPGFTSLIIYDSYGREVTKLVSERLSQGTHTVNWNPNNIASGIYYYKFSTEDFMETKKLILLK